jgi:very-short-patch-repair endonuclease
MAKYCISKSQYLKFKQWDKAKKLRRNMTSEERHVWVYLQALNGRLPKNVVWFRQVCVGKYIIDFACPRLKLGLEVDGSSHNGKERYDRVRQHFLERVGYEVLHICNVDTYDDKVLASFMNAVENKTLFRLQLG